MSNSQLTDLSRINVADGNEMIVKHMKTYKNDRIKVHNTSKKLENIRESKTSH